MPKKIHITPKILAYFKKNRLLKSSREMEEDLGIGRVVIRRLMKENGLELTKSESRELAVKKLRGRTTFTPEEDAFIIENHLKYPVKKIADLIGRSGVGVNLALKRLGLEIPRELIEQRKTEGRFSKGHVPMNKGLKQKEYMSLEVIEKTKATRFKKGHLPHNSVGIKNGDVRIRKDSSGASYSWIRIERGKWIPLHIYNYEQLNGPIPEKHVLRCLTDQTANGDPSNWKLITRKQNMEMNAIHQYPLEIKQNIIALSKLKKELIKIKSA